MLYVIPEDQKQAYQKGQHGESNHEILKILYTYCKYPYLKCHSRSENFHTRYFRSNKFLRYFTQYFQGIRNNDEPLAYHIMPNILTHINNSIWLT